MSTKELQSTRIWYVDNPVDGNPVPGAGATVQFGPINVAPFHAGRLRGSVHVDQDAAVGGFVLFQGAKQDYANPAFPTPSLRFVVTRDVTQPNFQYPFDVIVIQPFIAFTWTQGAAPPTFFRVSVEALPL